MCQGAAGTPYQCCVPLAGSRPTSRSILPAASWAARATALRWQRGAKSCCAPCPAGACGQESCVRFLRALKSREAAGQILGSKEAASGTDKPV